MSYVVSARIPATYTLLLRVPRHGSELVRSTRDESPVRWKATRNSLPWGHGGALKRATSGTGVGDTTGLPAAARGRMRNGNSLSKLSFVDVFRMVTLTRASCSYRSGRQTNPVPPL